MIIPSQRELFDIPAEVAYFNTAYLSPLPLQSLAAGVEGLRRKMHPWEIFPSDFFEDSERLRSAFASVIGATPDGIALIPSVSYGVEIAIAAVRERSGRLVLLSEQFPSNVYPWRALAREQDRELVMVPRSESGWTEPLLDAIDDDTAAVAIPICHWTDGSTVDLARVGARCRQTNSILVVDGTQSVGAVPFSIADVEPDFLVVAGYKWLLGPYSLGYLYVAPRHRDRDPIERNWLNRSNSEDFAGLVRYRDDFQPGARRFDVGERSNFALVPAALASLRLILELGTANIAETLRARTDAIAAMASDLGLRVPSPHQRAAHMLGVRFPHGAPPALLDHLSDANVFASLRGDSLRISPHVYSSDSDIERLGEVLAAATARRQC